jgi:hypothetical protein
MRQNVFQFVLIAGVVVAGTAAAELQNVIVNGYYSTKLEDRFSEVVETFCDAADGQPAIVLDRTSASSWRHVVAIPKTALYNRSFFTFYTRAEGASKAAPVRITATAANSLPFQCVLTRGDWQPY